MSPKVLGLALAIAVAFASLTLWSTTAKAEPEPEPPRESGFAEGSCSSGNYFANFRADYRQVGDEFLVENFSWQTASADSLDNDNHVEIRVKHYDSPGPFDFGRDKQYHVAVYDHVPQGLGSRKPDAGPVGVPTSRDGYVEFKFTFDGPGDAAPKCDAHTEKFVTLSGMDEPEPPAGVGRADASCSDDVDDDENDDYFVNLRVEYREGRDFYLVKGFSWEPKTDGRELGAGSEMQIRVKDDDRFGRDPEYYTWISKHGPLRHAPDVDAGPDPVRDLIRIPFQRGPYVEFKFTFDGPGSEAATCTARTENLVHLPDEKEQNDKGSDAPVEPAHAATAACEDGDYRANFTAEYRKTGEDWVISRFSWAVATSGRKLGDRNKVQIHARHDDSMGIDARYYTWISLAPKGEGVHTPGADQGNGPILIPATRPAHLDFKVTFDSPGGERYECDQRTETFTG